MSHIYQSTQARSMVFSKSQDSSNGDNHWSDKSHVWMDDTKVFHPNIHSSKCGQFIPPPQKKSWVILWRFHPWQMTMYFVFYFIIAMLCFDLNTIGMLQGGNNELQSISILGNWCGPNPTLICNLHQYNKDDQHPQSLEWWSTFSSKYERIHPNFVIFIGTSSMDKMLEMDCILSFTSTIWQEITSENTTWEWWVVGVNLCCDISSWTLLSTSTPSYTMLSLLNMTSEVRTARLSITLE